MILATVHFRVVEPVVFCPFNLNPGFYHIDNSLPQWQVPVSQPVPVQFGGSNTVTVCELLYGIAAWIHSMMENFLACWDTPMTRSEELSVYERGCHDRPSSETAMRTPPSHQIADD